MVTSLGDITDFLYVSSLVEETIDEYDSVDGIVNYIGVLPDGMTFKQDPGEW